MISGCDFFGLSSNCLIYLYSRYEYICMYLHTDITGALVYSVIVGSVFAEDFGNNYLKLSRRVDIF